MKKAVSMILSVSLPFFVAGCGNIDSLSALSDESSAMPDEVITVPEVSFTPEPETLFTPEPVENESDPAPVSCEIGDIVLADGSIVRRADFTEIDSSNFPMAVIAGFREDGTVFCVGVHRSDTPLQWASDDSAGYATGFTAITCTQESNFVFSGDKDGSDNWDAICAVDSEDTIDAEMNYPAFHFANTYAETYGLSGDYASGWYMPDIIELSGIYQNREAISNSLKYIYGLDSQAAMNGLETNWYWSSSQAGVQDDYAWFIHYFNGYAGECPKNFTNVHALAVHKLVVQAF